MRDWKVYDVGGHRSQVSLLRHGLMNFQRAVLTVRFWQRGMNGNWSCDEPADHNRHLTHLIIAAWAPFFDDMDAIIFLAPIRWAVMLMESSQIFIPIVKLL